MSESKMRKYKTDSNNTTQIKIITFQQLLKMKIKTIQQLFKMIENKKLFNNYSSLVLARFCN